MKVLVQDQLENQADIAANPETWINVSPQSTGAGLEAYIMLPEESHEKYDLLKTDLKNEINTIFYSTPLDAVKKALGQLSAEIG